MRKNRKTYTPEEKVGVIRRHLLDGTAVSDLYDEHDLNPTVYYRWQKEFFEGGGAAFAKESNRQVRGLKQRLAEAEKQLSRGNEVLAEVMGEYVRCKKTVGSVERSLGEAGAARRGGWLRRAPDRAHGAADGASAEMAGTASWEVS